MCKDLINSFEDNCNKKKSYGFSVLSPIDVALKRINSQKAMNTRLNTLLIDIDKGLGENIPFEYIKSLPLDKTIEHKGVKTTKFYDNGFIVKLDTSIVKGGEVAWHRHDDCVEEIKVVKGRLLDRLTGQKFIANDKIIYKAKEEHELEALEDTILEVKFIKV